MRFGNTFASPVAAASNLAGDAIASNMGKAMAVPNPLRKVRRGICHFRFMRDACKQLDDATPDNLQTQADKCATAPFDVRRSMLDVGHLSLAISPLLSSNG